MSGIYDNGVRFTDPNNNGGNTNPYPPGSFAASAWAKQHGTQSQQAAETQAEVNESGGHDPNRSQAEKDEQARLNSQGYVSPGATDVGGGPGMGEYYRQLAKSQEGNNDALQASNDSALRASLANMKVNRGTVVTENPAMVARDAATRQQQIGGLGLDRVAAEGGAPSAAAFQTRIGGNDIMAGQSGAMGAARGLSALNGAQIGGAATAGLSAGNLGMQGGLARSKEIVDAIGMYGSQAGNVRAGDLSRVQQTNQMANSNADLNDAWKLGNANLAAKQGALGTAYNQTDDAYYDASTLPAQKQLQYDQEMNAKSAGESSGEAGAAIAKGRADAANERQLIGGGVQAGLTAVGSLAGPVGAAAGSAGGGMLNSYISSHRDY